MRHFKHKIIIIVLLCSIGMVCVVSFPQLTNDSIISSFAYVENEISHDNQESGKLALKNQVSFNINYINESHHFKEYESFIEGNMMYEYYSGTKTSLPYYVIQPTNLSNEHKLPIIVWLHGSGGVSVSEETFCSASFVKYLLSLSEFSPNAYIICPQLKGEANSGRWNNMTSAQQISDILDGFILTHNVDETMIYVAGHSLGGQGALFVASNLNKFKLCVTFSPYNPGCDINTEIKTIAIVGKTEFGEDFTSVSYANKLSNIIGNNNLFMLDSNHGQLPMFVFTIDNDKNGKSDLLEWILKYNNCT